MPEYNSHLIHLIAGVFISLACSPSTVCVRVPCPEWDGAWYVQGKCFKLFTDKQRNWFDSKQFCKTQLGSILAEPRTLEQAKLLLSKEFRGILDVQIGATSKKGSTKSYFNSDMSEVELFTDLYDPTNYRWPKEGCMKIENISYVNQIYCHSDKGRYAACEIESVERYVIPQSVATRGIFSEVLLEIVPSERSNMELELNWSTYLYTTNNGRLQTINNMTTSSSSMEVTEHSLELYCDGANTTHYECFIELVPSQRVTVTLICRTAHNYQLRSLLHPSIPDIMGGHDEETYFVLVSSGMSENFTLSTISRSKDDISVTILFQPDKDLDSYILLRSVKILHPGIITMGMDQYQQYVNIHGTINFDGTEIWASREIAVFVTVFRRATHDDDDDDERGVNNPDIDDEDGGDTPSLTVSNIYQILSSRTASATYVTIPLIRQTDGTRSDLYRAVAFYQETNIEIPNHKPIYLPHSGSVEEISLPTIPYLVTGDKPFHLYRVQGGITTAESCMTYLVPRTMWKTKYTISKQLINQVEELRLHLIFEQVSLDAQEHQWSDFFDGEGIENATLIKCLSASGNGRVTVCTIEIWPQNTFDINVNMINGNQRFAAYTSWKSKMGEHRCQPLGLDWYQEWRNQLPTPPLPPANTSGPKTMMALCKQMIVSTVKANLTTKQIEKEVLKIKKELQVDTSKISSTVRKKTSAKDKRESSTGIGYVGIAMLAFVFGSLILSDVVTIVGQAIEVMMPNKIGRAPNDIEI